MQHRKWPKDGYSDSGLSNALASCALREEPLSEARADLVSTDKTGRRASSLFLTTCPQRCQAKSRTLRAEGHTGGCTLVRYSAAFLARDLPELLPADGRALSISSALTTASRNSTKESTDRDTPRLVGRHSPCSSWKNTRISTRSWPR